MACPRDKEVKLKNKELIFISCNEHLSKLSKIIKECIGNTIVVVGPGVSVDIPAAAENNIVYKAFEEYETKDHNAAACYEEAWQLIKEWGDFKIDGKHSFEDLSIYKNVCLWRVNNVSLFLYYLADMVYYIKMVDVILEQEKPERLFLAGSRFEIIERIFLEIAQQRGVQILHIPTYRLVKISFPACPVALERSYYLLSLEIRLCLPLQPYIWGLLLKSCIKGLLGKFYNFRVKTSLAKNHRNIVFYSSIKKNLDSVIPLVAELQKDSQNSVLVIDWFWKPRDAISVLKKENITHKVFDGYITLDICQSLWQRSKDSLQKWRLVENNRPFQEQFRYHGIFIWGLVSDHLKELFLRHFVKMSIFFDIAQRIVNTVFPDVVIVTNESEYTARLSVIAAKLKNVASLALQRGAFGKYDVDVEGPLYADRMVVDGEFAYQIFVKRGIKPEKIIIAGNPRYDIIKHIDSSVVRERVYKQLGLGNDKKVILLTSMFLNPTYHLADKKRLIRAVFSLAKKFPDFHLVVKLHPGETSDKLYREIRKKVGIENITILKEYNTLELIASCRMMITNHSTTGVEAMLLGKPFIFVNLSQIHPDWMPYAGSGAALGVYKEQDMEESVRNILSDTDIQERLRIGREKFVSMYVKDFDGQATQRVANIIKNMVAERLDNQ